MSHNDDRTDRSGLLDASTYAVSTGMTQVSYQNSSTSASNTLTINPSSTWTLNTTTNVHIPSINIVTGGPITTSTNGWTIGGNSSFGNVTYGDISVTRFGTPTYSDLQSGLRPGARWFPRGTTLKLQHDFYLWDRHIASEGFPMGVTGAIHLTGDQFVYLDVVEDMTTGHERHFFLAGSGKIVQYFGYLGDLSWRATVKSHFVEGE